MIKIYGVQRTGTTWLRALLRRNIEETVCMHEFGWKHGYVQPFSGEDFPLKAIIIVKNPYSWMRSINRWGNIEERIAMGDYGEHYTKMYRHYGEFINAPAPCGYERAVFVRYEALLENLPETLKRLCRKLDTPLLSTENVSKVPQSKRLTEERRRAYLNPKPTFAGGIDWGLFEYYGYEA